MPVLYKLYQETRKNSLNKGKWYARVVPNGIMTIDDVADRIQQNCTAKYSDVLSVLREFKEVLTIALGNGQTVKLAGLGTFKVGIKTRPADTAKEWTLLKNLVNYHVLFQPEVKVDPGTKKHTVSLLSKCSAQETAENKVDKTAAAVNP